MACWLYEGLLLFAVVLAVVIAVAFAASYLSGALGQTRQALDNRHALQAIVFVAAGVYFTGFWCRGQTLAQKTWRIRVLDRAGRTPTRARALLRYLTSWLWILPPLAALAPFALPARAVAAAVCAWVLLWALASRLHPQRQFWHDALAGTRLVRCDAADQYRDGKPCRTN